MKFQLIIPMSGIGKRFLDYGYSIPKPLIKVRGKEMVDHVVNMFYDIERVLFICNENHLKNESLKLEKILNKLHPNSKIISIKEHKKGPIHAVLKAEKDIILDLPTIINYCDFNSIFDFYKFKNFFKKENSDGIVFTYTGFHPHMLKNTNYAYIKKQDQRLINIQEKQPYTDTPMQEEVSSGTYFFKSGEIMMKYLKQTIDLNLNVKGEYYVSMAYKPMIEDGLKVNSFLIDYFMQWGTPQDLEEFNWHADIFDQYKNKYNNKSKEIKGNLIMPMAGLGSRFFKNGYKTPKPFINVSGAPMYLKAIRDLPKMESIKIITRNEIIKNRNILKDLDEEYKNKKVKILEKITQGQAITCLNAFTDDDIDTNESLLISACDMGIIFNKLKYDKLINSKDIDIIVWGCKGYPGAIKNPSMYSWIYEKDKYVSKVSVKRNLIDPKKDNVLIGTFTFKKAEDFIKATKINIKNKKLVNGEYYVDDVINKCIEIGLKVALFEIDYFVCWGTPEELLTYNYWESCFDIWEEHPFSIK
tara:strand:- start:243 stop:1826 length:1584 start_codon:yes stop_codon:yes gene_type:complete